MSAPVILDFPQQSYEWEQCRLGRPTGSRFDELLTPAKLQYSKGAEKYLRHLLAEWLVGFPVVENNASQFMDRGTEEEPRARAWYEFDRDVKVREVGFVLRSDLRAGCSPDGLVGDDGGLEIKVPALTTHIGYSETPGSLSAAYRGQVQGNLYITGRAWWDVLSFSPILPAVVERVEPDPEYHAALDAALGTFLVQLDALKLKYADHRQPRVMDGGYSPLPGEEREHLDLLMAMARAA